MNAELVKMIYDMGFPADRATMIHAFVGGSALHGVKLEGRDDMDLYGIFIEHPAYVLGLDRFEHFVTSTAAQSERYFRRRRRGLLQPRKWATLAPRETLPVLQFLFTPALQGDIFWSSVLACDLVPGGFPAVNTWDTPTPSFAAWWENGAESTDSAMNSSSSSGTTPSQPCTPAGFFWKEST